jgi:hypothetical protein
MDILIRQRDSRIHEAFPPLLGIHERQRERDGFVVSV